MGQIIWIARLFGVAAEAELRSETSAYHVSSRVFVTQHIGVIPHSYLRIIAEPY
jgi:hypothetical protein